MLDYGHRYDVFKIGCNNYLMITVIIPKDISTFAYEILGSSGTHIRKRIEGCNINVIVTEEVSDIDEILVFKYKIRDKTQFEFVKYNELMTTNDEILSQVTPDTTSSKLSTSGYYVKPNIHMIVSYEDVSSEDLRSDIHDDMIYDIEELGEEDDDVDDLYKPISDGEDEGFSFFDMDMEMGDESSVSDGEDRLDLGLRDRKPETSQKNDITDRGTTTTTTTETIPSILVHKTSPEEIVKDKIDGEKKIDSG